MHAVVGKWSVVHTEALYEPYPTNSIVLQIGLFSSSRWTGPLSFARGVVTQVELADFTRTEWPGATAQDEGDMMDSSDLSRPSAIDVIIIARLRPNGRIEFGIRLPDSDQEIFPTRRFLPVSPPVGRWLRSTPVGVDIGDLSIPVGSIIARRAANGRTEFGFRPDWSQVSDQFPRQRFFPADSEVDRWLRSSVITVQISP